MEFRGLVRNYNDAYLRELGAAGTAGLPVFRPGAGGLLKARSMRADITCGALSGAVVFPFVDLQGDDYVIGSVNAPLSWAAETKRNVAFGGRIDQATGGEYCNGDCSGTPAMTGVLWTGAYRLRCSHTFTNSSGRNCVVIFDCHIGAVHAPWWGENRQPGYFPAPWRGPDWLPPATTSYSDIMPEGSWGIPCRVLADFTNNDQGGASCELNAVICPVAPFHRMRGAARAFSGAYAVVGDAWEETNVTTEPQGAKYRQCATYLRQSALDALALVTVTAQLTSASPKYYG